MCYNRSVKYRDVFISYRRSDGLYPAYLLYDNLMDNHYSVFFDKKSMKAGEFPTQIKEAINHCKDFILLVTPDLFSKRIFKKGDWCKKEIETALSRKDINILLIFTEDIVFPKKLPKEIDDIRNYQSETIKDVNDLDELQTRLFAKYLKSSPTSFDNRDRCSIYDLDFGKERERLVSQGGRYDEQTQKILDEYLTGDKYIALDVGCAQGYTTTQTYRKAKYKKVIGIDINEQGIKEAIKDAPSKKYSYYPLDVEREDFVEEMKKIMDKEGIKGFDVISCFLVLHHLKDGQKAIKELKKLLNKGGMIIIRGSDDGTKISYGDDGLIEKIINSTYQIDGLSDRHNGRKLFTWVVDAGFSNVRMHTSVTDTSNMTYEEKQGLFQVSFGYRINYFKKQLEMHNDDESLKEFKDMENMLTKLESVFARNDFWYSLNRYVCVGFKK